ncbi:hypothetical protein Bbelb_097100 [Branchiostoma belcheri]|nr:hypothetical protein Bbelb_097100 [Branchiostoma belcheri]
MGRKLRHVLIFLLIILKEPNMPEAGCRSKCGTYLCECTQMLLTSIPQNLPKAYDTLASISTVAIGKNPWQCDCRMAPFRLKMNGPHSFEDQIVCSQPAKLKGRKLKDIDPKNLVCKDDGQLENGNYSYNSSTSHTSHYHWHFNDAGLTGRPVGTTFTTLSVSTRKPENNTSHENYTFHESDPRLPPVVVIASVFGSIAVVVLICTIILAICYKRGAGKNPKDVLNVKSLQSKTQLDALQVNKFYEGIETSDENGQRQSPISESNTNTTASSVVAEVHDQQYENNDQHDPTDQDHQFENNEQHNKKIQPQSQASSVSETSTTASVVPIAVDCQYEDMTQHKQTGQGQSQVFIGSKTNTTASVVASDLDHHYEDMSQQNQPRQGQSLATKSNTNTTATVVASDHENMETQHDQTGQGKSDPNTDGKESSTTRIYVIYTTEQAASEPDALYKSENDHTGQVQTQAITDHNESLATTNVIYTTNIAGGHTT